MEGLVVHVACGVAVLGSTGSIGTNTLTVLQALGDRFRVTALAAGRNVDLLIRQALEFQPDFVAVARAEDAQRVQDALGPRTAVGYGPEGLVAAATVPETHIVVTGVVGAVGIRPTIEALRRGRRIALANKETLVAAGAVVMEAMQDGGGEIVPVDSEHSAIHQVLSGADSSEVGRLLLTASGGPFRTCSLEEMALVRPEDALRHPTWRMGGKITVDSATLMNKGLEVIEAHWLFGVDYDRIDVLVHPQSIVHSLVEFVDGSVMAQLGVPDMKGPIHYALCYPGRQPSNVPRLSLTEVKNLTFEEPDVGRFRSLALAYEAGRAGGTAPAVLNAANEEAVAAFLDGRIGFLDIPACVERTLDRHEVVHTPTLEAILEADRWARREARHAIRTGIARSIVH